MEKLMTDVVSPTVRSRMMAGIRGKNTRPEMRLRRFLHGKGFRYRLHQGDLPGSPDLLLPRYRTAIFVHGCFWHRHPGCRLTTTPATNQEFWADKFAANVARDHAAVRKLLSDEWNVIIIWECGLKIPNAEECLGWLPARITAGDGGYLEWPVIAEPV